ncbi:hypothetical protein A2Z22_01595 [Candidatus Woesebacteria bacterium RBG_16_34_12]|uniref:Methyltransferase domain-containing protein n=1 Tax=Candidatus Woesebacteria bacterium RBG_16_34_12 TaxID=1802480 RepID=A0A1F7XA47_9BACT|nr:MAG: hypothetical protein A2Z22_01595 [Candidatus Woesebacteria bacterium RBG_16_34_12]
MDELKENTNIRKTLANYHVKVDFSIPPSEDVILTKARRQGEERARFWNMLVDIIPASGFLPPQDRPTTILHLGCGRAQEADVLAAYFGGGQFGSNSNQAIVVGVDIDNVSIKNAINFNSIPQQGVPTRYKIPDNMTFICGNATDLSMIKEVPEEVDVVIVRHQQISDDEDTWKKIFTQGTRRLRNSGIVLLTSFSDPEHRMLRQAINELDLNLRIVVDQTNKWGRELQPGGAVLDKKVLVVKKT